VTARRLIGSALALQWRAAPVASSVAVALTIATGSLSAVSAWLTKELLDELGPAGDPARAIAFAIAGAIAAAAAVVGWRMCQHLDSIIRARITTAGARELYGTVVRIDGLRHFDDPAFHTRLRLADEAARGAPQQLVSLLQTVLRTAIALASLAAIVVAVWPPLGLLLAATGSLSVIAQLLRLREDAALRSRLARSGRRIDGLRFALVDPRSAKEIRLLDSGDWLCDRMVALIDREGRAQVARERSAALIQIGLGVAGALAVAIGTVVVVGRVTAGQLALGDVALVTAAAAGVQTACAGLASELGRAGPTLVAFRAYLDVLAIAPEHPGELEAPPLMRGIELRDVWFRYRDDGPWVLAGVNLVLPAGSSTGLVGVNGAGKSTLIKLLARFYDVDRGAILWDGIDIRRLDPRSLRRSSRRRFRTSSRSSCRRPRTSASATSTPSTTSSAFAPPLARSTSTQRSKRCPTATRPSSAKASTTIARARRRCRAASGSASRWRAR